MAKKQRKRSAAGAGSLRQRKDGTWEGRFTYKDEFGRTKRRSIYGSTQKECRQKLTAALKSVDDGAYRPPERMTVGAWLELWLDTYCIDLKPRTRALYRETVNARINPYIGEVQLSALTHVQVQRFCNALVARPLAPKTVKNVHGILHKALEQAVVNGLIDRNPSDRTKLPKVKRAELRPLMDEDIAQFIHEIHGNRYEALFLLALFSGMRQSELLGLQWDDVDLGTGKIIVCRQLQRVYHSGGQYIHLSETKNGKPRIVSIAPSIVSVLRQHRASQAEWRLAAGSAWDNPHNLVFTDELGGHLKHNTVRKHFKRAVSNIGLPETRFHDLRHSYAINALQIGDGPKAVQEQLGHYSSAFTMDIYAEVSETMRQESQDRMERFIKSVSDL